MLRTLREGRRRHGLREFLRRYGRTQVDRTLYRVERKHLVRAFRELGVEPGVTLCAHSSLRRLGYVVGGAEAVIDALQEALGPRGTLMMPSFAAPRSALEHLESGEVFDARATPSRSGTVTEIFRRRPGVERSLHPTNAVTAQGPRSQELLASHEASPTPFGHETPYGRLARWEDGFVLMLETHIHSLLHHLQERVELPTLFLPHHRAATVVDAQGRRRDVTTRVMRPRIPYYVAIPSPPGKEEPDWAILHDFALVFPSRREALIRAAGYTFEGYPRIRQRREELVQAGVLRTHGVGRGEMGLLHAPGFIQRIEPEFCSLIHRFREHYDSDVIHRMNLPYL